MLLLLFVIFLFFVLCVFFFFFVFFFFNDTATTEIYTLSLHDALPICGVVVGLLCLRLCRILLLLLLPLLFRVLLVLLVLDRKSTRLNSSHGYISYAVFCLKKKNNRSTAHTKYVRDNKIRLAYSESSRYFTPTTQD